MRGEQVGLPKNLVWRKSTFSAAEANCVEVAWRKSSFSGGDSDCVEVAWPGAEVLVRDSKNPGADHLAFPASALTHLREVLR